MKITVNDETIEVRDGYTLGDIAQDRNLPDRGIAMAVNNEMITCGTWTATILNDGDNVTILRAFAGG